VGAVAATRRRGGSTTGSGHTDVRAAEADALSILPASPPTSTEPEVGEGYTTLRPVEAAAVAPDDRGVGELIGLTGLNLVAVLVGIALAVAVAWVVLQLDRRRFDR
jgi:hypothetical protein